MVIGSELNSATNFHGFLNSTANDLSATSKFEPIFLRKSRLFSRFPSVSKKVACFGLVYELDCRFEPILAIVFKRLQLPFNSALRFSRHALREWPMRAEHLLLKGLEVEALFVREMP